jgi:diguanylate cyclase (GGDEF)-like protein
VAGPVVVGTAKTGAGRWRAAGRLALVLLLVAVAVPWWAGWPVRWPTAYWVLAGLAVLVDARSRPGAGKRTNAVVLPSVCLTFAIVLAWGFAPALAVQAVAIGVARCGQPLRRTLHLLAQYAAALAAAAGVAGTAGLRLPLEAVRWTDTLLVLGAAVAWTAARFAAAWVIVKLAGFVPAESAPAAGARVELPTTGAMLLLGAVLPAVAQTSVALLPLVVVPLFAVDRMTRSMRENARAARTDVLTGLPNRRALVAAAGRRMAPGQRTAVLLLDLDRFKDVNDAFGHPAGDALLLEVAERLAAAVPAHDLVARLGGDEFAVLVTRAEDAEAARQVARHLGAVLATPVLVDGVAVDVSAAIGVALYPEHGDEPEALLRRAELAMYAAKQAGEPFALHTPGADDDASHRLALLADLRVALRDDTQIMQWYQPQVVIATGAVLGVEALLRWRHPVHGMIAPEEIIRVAEQTTVMRDLTDRVVTDAVAQIARWRAAGRQIRVAVNVSVRDLQSDHLPARIEQLLHAYGVPAALLQVEITESALMTDARQVLSTVGRLHQLGIAIALDDFGTGYSSLQHLRRLPLSEIKIDRSFVLGMTGARDDAAIVRSVVDLAAALGLRVVAEGVEDDRTWRALHAAGCHAAQGWFYGRPMPADDLLTWLSRYRPVSPARPALPSAQPAALPSRAPTLFG